MRTSQIVRGLEKLGYKRRPSNKEGWSMFVSASHMNTYVWVKRGQVMASVLSNFEYARPMPQRSLERLLKAGQL